DTPGCAINAILGHHVPSSEIPVPPDNQSSNLRFWHVLQRRCPVENASTWLPPCPRMLYKWPREIGSPSTTPGAYEEHPRTGAHFSGLGDTRAMAWAHRKTVFLMQIVACWVADTVGLGDCAWSPPGDLPVPIAPSSHLDQPRISSPIVSPLIPARACSYAWQRFSSSTSPTT
ncbi:hypothetical protein MRX96_052369, partial [Rhipicephalus microplus]